MLTRHEVCSSAGRDRRARPRLALHHEFLFLPCMIRGAAFCTRASRGGVSAFVFKAATHATVLRRLIGSRVHCRLRFELSGSRGALLPWMTTSRSAANVSVCESLTNARLRLACR